MTKPRVFIGSSVEGLNVAYPVQQNLSHAAEVTVWGQGIFELSGSTIESLTRTLEETDFAIFIFSPDDMALIRKESARVVRDNVLFEFGLFIGKLGRERVFFMVPSQGDLHLPTDLLGVTPGKYESRRQDGNMQAATGAVCHQIQQQMKTIGVLPGKAMIEESKDRELEEKTDARDWAIDLYDKKFASAKAKLERILASESGEDALKSKALVLYCDLKVQKNFSVEAFTRFANENSQSPGVQSVVASVLQHEGYSHEALRVLLAAKEMRPKDSEITIAIARYYKEEADIKSAIDVLQDGVPEDDPNVTIELADLLESDGKMAEALQAVQRCHAKNQRHTHLRYKYARLAMELNNHQIAAHLLDSLTSDEPNSIENWGYLGNTCSALKLYDVAIAAYRKAEKINPNAQWIIDNIGNVLSGKGLPTEASQYFERALAINKDNEFAHDRLAQALKSRATERKEFEKQCAEGKRQVREAAKQFQSNPGLAA